MSCHTFFVCHIPALLAFPIRRQFWPRLHQANANLSKWMALCPNQNWYNINKCTPVKIDFTSSLNGYGYPFSTVRYVFFSNSAVTNLYLFLFIWFDWSVFFFFSFVCLFACLQLSSTVQQSVQKISRICQKKKSTFSNRNSHLWWWKLNWTSSSNDSKSEFDTSQCSILQRINHNFQRFGI